MIIEIKDLPDGVMIKNINIDFVEGTVTNTDTSVSTANHIKAPAIPPVQSVPPIKSDSLPKADQSIPSEMLNNEF